MTGFAYRDRLAKARQTMAAEGVDVLFASLGSDLPYLTGYTAMPGERLTMLVLPVSGDATLVVPELEAPRVVVPDDLFDVRAWGELEDPVAIVAELAGKVERAMLGDRTWATFLMRLDAAMDVGFESATPVMSRLRIRKDHEETARLRNAGAAVDRVAAQIPSMRFEGRAERDLGRDIAELTVAEGHDASTFTIIASGPNAASPHHATGDRIIGVGDSVVIDFGGSWGGYQSDTTRTFHVGEPDAEVAAAFVALHAAQAAGVAAVRPGVTAESVDRAARQVLTDAGYGDYFIHRLGHGIGLDGHEDPYIIEGNSTELEPTMAFSIEPGVYVPGRYGMRIEDIVTVTEDGVENLNNSPRELVVVE